MSDLFNLSEEPNFGLKSNGSTSQMLMMNKKVEENQNDDPILKTTYPIYLYKPPFGYPRNVNVVFLRQLATNPYVFSVIKAITDQAAETDWEIALKEDVELDTNISEIYSPEEAKYYEEKFGIKTLNDAKNYIKEFYKNPNSDNESFAQLLRKVIPDILILDSGVINKVYNKRGELKQLRAVDGGAILKNPDQHGSLDNREDIILDDGYTELGAGNGYKVQAQAYKLALDRYNAYGYNEMAAYFQFAYGINYSVPIPYGKKEIIYMMENPATETVYSRSSALESAVDITLNLIYSSKASLDLFINSNIPSGIIKLAEADQEDTTAFQNSLYQQQYSGYDQYGFQRKVNGRLPVVGNPSVDFIPFNYSNNENKVIEIQQWFTKVLWSCFGVTASEMGFTQGDSRATDESQRQVNAKKAVKPRLNMVGNYLNDQVQPELPFGDLFEFVFRYDEEESVQEKEKWDMYEKKINLGVMTPRQVAELEGIEYEGGQPLQGQQQNNGSQPQNESNEGENNESTENKSMGTESGGGGVTDTPLVPVETKPIGKYKDFEDCVRKNSDKKDPEAYCGSIQNKVENKSAYQFDDNYVLTGKSKEDLLRQAVELLEQEKQEEEELPQEHEESEEEEEPKEPTERLYKQINDNAQQTEQENSELAEQEEFKSLFEGELLAQEVAKNYKETFEGDNGDVTPEQEVNQIVKAINKETNGKSKR